ncbi:MAG: hypothetical protein KDE27_07735, partial [Planctomycetes bacterium]|nr:hypothetical protein [Planctomycetota bacterium]
MASDPDALRRRRAGNAVTSWSQTVRTLRQHGGVARLLDRAVLGCRRELATVLATEDLTIELAGGEVRCAGQTVLTYGRADVPFGLLAEAGVGTVILGRGTAEPELERLLRTCAAAPGNHDASYDLARALRAADLPGLSLRAPSRSRRVGSTAPGVDWWLLPAPHPNAELTRSIEREHAANLPARAMRLLLADLETGTPDRPTGPLLEALLDTMLARDDAAGAAELLERVAHSSAVSDAT